MKNEDQVVASSYRRLFHPDTIFIRLLFPADKLPTLPWNNALRKAKENIRSTVLSMIRVKERSLNTESHAVKDIVGFLIEQNRKNREEGIATDVLTEDEMVNQIMTILAARSTLIQSFATM